MGVNLKDTIHKNIQKGIILADAHVHIHNCFNLTQLLNSAFNNFAQVATKVDNNSPYSAVLFLAETSQDDYFNHLSALAKNGSELSPEFKIETTQEKCSIVLNHVTKGKLYLIAGRQIITAEKLEVLGLTTSHKIEDGKPIQNVINYIIDCGGIPVIPWGFGKWIGHRGKVLEDLLKKYEFPYLFLGDNSGRPRFWSNPHYFELARKEGIPILPGSDPLPFSSEFRRPGSFGFTVYGTLNNQTPAQSIKKILLKPSVEIRPYGLAETTYRFIQNQIIMQVIKSKKLFA